MQLLREMTRILSNMNVWTEYKFDNLGISTAAKL